MKLIFWVLSPNPVLAFLGAATMVAAQSISFGIGIPRHRPEASVPATPTQIEQTGATRVVTYDTPDGEKIGAMPSFRHTVVALNFGGPLAAKVKLTLMKRQGVRSFAEGSNPCDLPGQAVVCFSFGKPYHSDPFSSSAYGSSYGSRGGGASNGASESGEFAGSTIYAVLIAADGEMFELGEASSSAFAGQSSGYGSSNGVSFNSSFSSTATISPSTAIAIAQQRAISKFVDPRWWKKLDQTTTVQWFPGAAEAVREAFPR